MVSTIQVLGGIGIFYLYAQRESSLVNQSKISSQESTCKVEFSDIAIIKTTQWNQIYFKKHTCMLKVFKNCLQFIEFLEKSKFPKSWLFSVRYPSELPWRKIMQFSVMTLMWRTICILWRDLKKLKTCWSCGDLAIVLSIYRIQKKFFQ